MLEATIQVAVRTVEGVDETMTPCMLVLFARHVKRCLPSLRGRARLDGIPLAYSWAYDCSCSSSNTDVRVLWR